MKQTKEDKFNYSRLFRCKCVSKNSQIALAAEAHLAEV
jgi:hypothetical protein